MKAPNKTFLILALITASTLTYFYVSNNMSTAHGGILGKDSTDISIDDLNFDDGDLESSLEKLDSYLDAELEDDLEDIDLDSEELEIENEIEQEIDSVEYDLETSTSQQQTTKKTTKIQKLFFLIPVEIESTRTVTESGYVLQEEQTLLGKLLDLFSF